MQRGNQVALDTYLKPPQGNWHTVFPLGTSRAHVCCTAQAPVVGVPLRQRHTGSAGLIPDPLVEFVVYTHTNKSEKTRGPQRQTP